MAHLLLKADGHNHTVEFEGTAKEFLVEFAILTGQILEHEIVSRETFLNWVTSDEFRAILDFMNTEATKIHFTTKGGKREKKDTCYRRRRPAKRRQV